MLNHTKKIKELYEEIQKKIFYMIPEKWEKLYLYASVIDTPDEKTKGELFFYYVPRGIFRKKTINGYEIPARFNLDEDQYMKLVESVYQKIKELREEFRNNTIIDEIWSNITITIQNMKFRVEYDYENLQESDFSSYERHVVWRVRYLGITPDQCSKEEKHIIRKYCISAKTLPKREVYEAGIYIRDIENIIGYTTQINDNEPENTEKLEQMHKNQILFSRRRYRKKQKMKGVIKMMYSKELEGMCTVAKGVNHGPAPIPEEGKWVKAKEIKDISGLTHGIGWCAPQQGACKLTLNVKEGIIQEALIETIGCSGMTHSAAMAGEILTGKTLLEALNTDLVCDAINTAMRELFLQIVYGRTQTAFSEGGLPVGAGLEDLGKGHTSQVGTIYSSTLKGPRYLNLAEGYIVELGLDKDDQIIGYKYVHLGKMMDNIKAGIAPEEAIEKASGKYGRFDEAVKKIDPREQ